VAQKITILVLIFLVILASAGMCIAIDSKISELESEMAVRFYEQKVELEEVKKNQRITAQDVDFLEKMIKEEL